MHATAAPTLALPSRKVMLGIGLFLTFITGLMAWPQPCAGPGGLHRHRRSARAALAQLAALAPGVKALVGFVGFVVASSAWPPCATSARPVLPGHGDLRRGRLTIAGAILGAVI